MSTAENEPEMNNKPKKKMSKPKKMDERRKWTTVMVQHLKLLASGLLYWMT